MLNHTMIGTNDIEKSKAFYNATAGRLGRWRADGARCRQWPHPPVLHAQWLYLRSQRADQ